MSTSPRAAKKVQRRKSQTTHQKDLQLMKEKIEQLLLPSTETESSPTSSPAA
jgi:hypothetical protein